MVAPPPLRTVNPRATIALFVVTLLVVGGLFYLRQTVPASRDRAEMHRYALVFPPEDIDEIEIVRGNDTVNLQRDASGWRITAPIEDRASPETVDRLLTTARFLEVRDRIAGKDSALMADSGLRNPRFRILLRGRGDFRLDLGADTMLPGQIFARTGDDNSILRVPATIVELVTAPAASFRDPRLTDLVADDIEKFTVRRADGEMTLRRERGRWLIEKPVRTEADPRAVRAFLEPLLGLRITGFGSSLAAADSPAVLPGQIAGITLTTRGGSGIDLEIERQGGSETPETVTARFAPRGGALAVDASALALFEISPEALRERSLGFVDEDTVDRIVLASQGRSLTLIRNDNAGWTAKEQGRPVPDADVAALIEMFNAARIESFRPAVAPGETGLDTPAESVAFYSWLSENSAEEAAGGHVIAQAELGSPCTDKTVYARTGHTGEVVTVDNGLAKAVRRLVTSKARTADKPTAPDG